MSGEEPVGLTGMVKATWIVVGIVVWEGIPG